MLIIGANGFAKELLSVIEDSIDIVFYDDINPKPPTLLFDRFPILRSHLEAVEYFETVTRDFILGIANPHSRYDLRIKFIRLGGNLKSFVALSAKIGNFGNYIGIGTTIMANVVIEINNSIGECCLIHNRAFISHDTIVGNYTEISPAVNILGNVKIGDFCRIGTNATILPNISIGNNVIIGAGAVVTKDVCDNSILTGVPAKPVNKVLK